MRTKTANEIRKILKYLVSPDEELMNLGIGLFKDCYLLTQLNKNEIFEVEYRWPGFSSNQPPHFKDIPRYGKILKFTKGQFIKMLNSQSTSIYKKACLILSFVYSKVDYSFSTKNRNSNYELKNAITYYERLNKNLVCEIERLEGKAHYKRYFDPENRQITSQIANFQEEINNLNLNDNLSYLYNIRDLTPKSVISSYNDYLNNNYRAKYKRKWIRDNRKQFSDQLNISIADFDLFTRTGLCSYNFYDVLKNNKFFI